MSDQNRLNSLETGEQEPKERRRTWLWVLLALLLLCILGGAGVALGRNGFLGGKPTPTFTPVPQTEEPTLAPSSEATKPTDEPTEPPTVTDEPTVPPTDVPTDEPTASVCTADPTDGVCCREAGETYPGEPVCPTPPPSCTANPADGICCAAAGETYLTSPSECPCIANATDGLCCTTAGETHDNDPNECRDTSGPCSDHGGLQWEGDVCVCPGLTDHVMICADGTKTDYVTDQSCEPDAGACQPSACPCTCTQWAIPCRTCGRVCVAWTDCNGSACSP